MRSAWCWSLFFFLAVGMSAASAKPVVLMEAHLLNEAGENSEALDVKVGQRVTLALDILTDSWFARAPEIQPMDLSGAIHLQPEQFGTNYSVNRQGVSYAVQRREITIFPQRPGQIIVPSLEAKVWVAGPDRQRLPEQVVRSEPLVFQVSAITAEDGSNTTQPLLVAQALSLTETYDPNLELVREEGRLFAGDAIVRRVAIRAQGTLGMLIKPLEWPAVDGVNQQSSRAQVSDRTNRGEFTGIRIESRSYVFERPGDYVLPALNVQWWDQTQQQIIDTALPEQIITVSPGGLLKPGDSKLESADSGVMPEYVWRRWLPALLLIVVGVLVLVWLAKITVRKLNHTWSIYQQGERYHRRRLLSACAQQDNDAIVNGFYRWRRLLDERDQQSAALLALQQAVIDFYHQYYTLSDQQRDDALAVLVDSIHAVPHREESDVSHYRAFHRLLPRARKLTDLNPSR